ncbi:MAG: Probable peptidyl-prolyl cis-trans isomerase B (PPIase B) (Rotamase B) [uncultured Friedmanniella sp.]|uniref:Probable peptidyl-prolyl cis-trans isomerase B (PPIase B) (Rotamase B) n=1 Tax=uncultured Friedmanniella sp. TaxID=335381 RepID=A0A6J4L5G3_9ACTN|nr:MAG: Probable peptidyl-prolyl cis-trans isomerase B (PPIase B) (Rotamase B) [uncultured Friedmanniella sp.]
MSRRTAATAVLAGLLLAGCGSSDEGDGGTRPAADGDTVTCEWVAAGDGPAVVDVGTPPEQVPATGTGTLTLALGQGPLELTLDRAGAPCAAASFTHLAEQGFFDGSPCHREVNLEQFGVLQCGDPSGTGRGGPSYRFGVEVTDETSYPRGTVAMANSGQPDSTGSQFFLCFTDSQLPPDYTVVGTVDEAGLEVLDGIAEAGNDGSFEPSPGGGAPAEPVTIESVTVG